jgi:glutathione S-transferase
MATVTATVTPPRLITIAFSHYCEKARWALDRADIDYVEDAHLPLFAYLPLRRAGAKRTVPALVTGDGEVLVDSTDILKWCDAHGRGEPLFPPGDDEVAALEDEFDHHLGPATRRLGYFYMLGDKRATLDVMAKHGPRWERVLGKASRPVAAALLKRGLRIDAAGAERSRAVIDRTFSEVAERLKDGRTFLCGDRLTAADLTFASLAAPVLLPEQYSEYLPREELVPPAFRDLADAYRKSPAGQYGLRVYLER